MNNRHFFEGACWILRTGAPWRDLPANFGRWQTVYRRFARWSRKGIWARIYRAMRSELGCVRSVCAMDSTSIRVHQHGAPSLRQREEQAVGISRGGKTTKVHLLAGRGRGGSLSAWRGVLSAGQRSDISAAPPLLRSMPPWVRTVIADRAYDAAWLRLLLQEKAVRSVIPYRCTALAPAALDRKSYAKRNVVERLFARIKHFRRVATRYDKLAVTFGGFLLLAFVASCSSVL